MGFSVNMSFGPMKGNFKAFPAMRSTTLIFAIPIPQIVVRSLKPLRVTYVYIYIYIYILKRKIISLIPTNNASMYVIKIL